MPERICARASGLKASGDAGRNDELAALAENDEPVAGQRHRSGEEPILAPAHLAGPQFDGAEALAELLAPVESVQDAIVVDARRIVVRQDLVRRPQLVERRAVEAEQPGARSVLGRDENQIADHERRRHVDRCRHPRAPRALKLHLPCCGIQTDQSRARKKDRDTPSRDRRSSRRRVARLVVRSRSTEAFPVFASNATMPAFGPPTLASTRPSSTSGDPAAPKNPFGTRKRCMRVHAPDARALRQVDGVELPLRTERVDDAVRDDRHRARTLVESEVVAVGRRVGVAPLARARARIDRFDNLLVPDAVEQDDAPLGDDRAAESLADVLAPDDARSLRRPRSRRAPVRGTRRCARDRGTAASLRPQRG